MLIFHKGHTDTIQVYSVTVMTHVKALQAGHSSQGTSEPITPALQPTTDADDDIPSCRDKKENYGPQKRARSDTDFPSITPANSNCGEYSERFDRPVMESVTARVTDTDKTLVMSMSTVVIEQSELREMVLCETDKWDTPVNR